MITSKSQLFYSLKEKYAIGRAVIVLTKTPDLNLKEFLQKVNPCNKAITLRALESLRAGNNHDYIKTAASRLYTDLLKL